MSVTAVLDILQRLHEAAQHPDIASVYRYGTERPSLGIVYQSGAKAFFETPAGRRETRPVEMPEKMPEYKFRALHALKFCVELLEAAKPAGIEGWRTVAFEGVALQPSGLEVRTGAGSVFLRVTSGGAPAADSDPSEWADYRIPEGIAG